MKPNGKLDFVLSALLLAAFIGWCLLLDYAVTQAVARWP